MDTQDYILYMCSAGYNDSSISQLVGDVIVCPNPKPSVLDVNLPSITIPDLKTSVTLTRTVTNVGRVNSVYRAVVEPPFGVTVRVTPNVLVFNSTATKISFKVAVSTRHKVNTGYYFGSLSWIDGVHVVSSPISVRTQILQFYTDDN